MEQGTSIKRAAKELGISIQTSFDWRHKILASMQSTLSTKLEGVIECDDFQMAESFNGQKKLDRQPRKRGTDSRKHSASKISVLTAVSRGKGGLASVVAAKKISSKEALAALDALDNKLEPGSILITDEASSYNAIARKNPNITHKKVSSKKNRTTKPSDKIHLQTVNNQHKQIRDFLIPFNGVSTKYLPNYLNWFFYQKSQLANREKVKTLLYTCLMAATSLKWLSKIIQNEILIRT
jgi:transposase-like protein